MEKDFQYAIDRELDRDEKVQYTVQPEADSIVAAKLIHAVLWMSGLFSVCVGILRHTTGDTTELVHMQIALLILWTASVVIDLLLAPRRSKETIYAVTDKRVISLTVAKAWGASDDYPQEEQTIRFDNKRSKFFFKLVNIIGILAVVSIVWVMLQITEVHADPFFWLGLILITMVRAHETYMELLLPMSRFRGAPGAVHSLGNLVISVRSLTLDALDHIFVRRARRKLGNIILVSREFGCLRLLAIPELDNVLSCIRSNKDKMLKSDSMAGT